MSFKDSVDAVIDDLTDKEKEVLKKRFTGNDGVTQAAIERMTSRLQARFSVREGHQVESDHLVDIVKVVSDTVELRLLGKIHVGLCPFHEDGTIPSFHVNRKTGRFYCFGCHEKGTSVDFIMKLKGVGFVEALKLVSDEKYRKKD